MKHAAIVLAVALASVFVVDVVRADAPPPPPQPTCKAWDVKMFDSAPSTILGSPGDGWEPFGSYLLPSTGHVVVLAKRCTK
jgi:hypothetical protein